MACWHLGSQDEARQRFDKAIKLMDQCEVYEREELSRFRDEAAELLKLAGPVPKEATEETDDPGKQ
jgi:hypothetical protein